MDCVDLICMGFQKCGTTTLFEIFRQHPDVVLCRDVKEPMYYRVPFFIQMIGRGQKYYNWRYFAHVTDDDPRMRGEINAGLTFTHCAEKLNRDLDRDVKMIFMMRNPADRSYSAYKYFLARGFLPEKDIDYDLEHGHAQGFDHYCHSVLDDRSQRSKIMKKRLKYLVFSQSNYAACIEDYLKYFPKTNMKFVIFEEFIKDQHAACLDIYDFLGLKDYDSIDYSVRANEGNEKPVSGHMARKFKVRKGWNYAFYEFMNITKWAPGLYGIYKRYFERFRDRTLVPDDDRSPMYPQTRDYLMRYYRKDIKRLEGITGKDLTAIWCK